VIDIARDPQAQPRPPRYRVGLLKMLELSRQGRLDGRLAMPDPLTAIAPVTTEARQALERQLAERIGETLTAHVEHTSGDRRELARLAESLPALRREADEIRARLEAAEPAHPEDAEPVRRLGELGRPVELIRNRRRRERERPLRPLRERLPALERAIREAEREIAQRQAAIASGRQVAAARATRLHATYQYMRSLYDRALVRRHPNRTLLERLLEHAEMPMPDWVTATAIDRQAAQPIPTPIVVKT
jgi:predicted  nucleic acid-binding Zn-ribbon protein